MKIEPEHGSMITIAGCARTLTVTHAGQYLHASTPHPGFATVLEVKPGGPVSLLLFDHVDDFRRWRVFTKDLNSYVYLVNEDGTLELIVQPPRKENPPCPDDSTTS